MKPVKFYIQAEISREKLLALRCGDPRQPCPYSWVANKDPASRKGPQDLAIERWLGRETFVGVLVANDLSPTSAAKEYAVMTLCAMEKMSRLNPPNMRSMYELPFGPDDTLEDPAALELPWPLIYQTADLRKFREQEAAKLPSERLPTFSVANYITPVNAYADTEVYIATNPIKTMEAWLKRERYLLKFFERFLMDAGILLRPEDLQTIIQDSSILSGPKAKFSRHYVWKIWNVGYVKINDVSALMRCLQVYVHAKVGPPQADDNLWYIWTKAGDGKQFMFDSIYTKHRCFRACFHTKLGQDRALYPAAGFEDLLPRGADGEPTCTQRELPMNIKTVLRASIFTPREGRRPGATDAEADTIQLLSLYEPDGLTPSLSSSKKPTYRSDGSLLSRAANGSRILDGLKSADAPIYRGLIATVRSGNFKVLSELQWKGKGGIGSEMMDFGSCKPVFAVKLVEEAIKWMFDQTLAELHNMRANKEDSADLFARRPRSPPPAVPADPDTGEPPAKKQRRAVEDTPIGDLTGRNVQLYKSSFNVATMEIHSQLAEPKRFCPIMFWQRRQNKVDREKALGSKSSGSGSGTAAPLPGGSVPSLFHTGNNTGLRISLETGTMAWSCLNETCMASRPIPLDISHTEFWLAHKPAIDKLFAEIKQVFTVDVAEELAGAFSSLSAAASQFGEHVSETPQVSADTGINDDDNAES